VERGNTAYLGVYGFLYLSYYSIIYNTKGLYRELEALLLNFSKIFLGLPIVFERYLW
jgi:hypothetical protein